MSYFTISYRNNLDRIPAEVVEGTKTPAQYIREHNISLGNYSLQMNGIPLSSSDNNKSFSELAAGYGISADTDIVLAGVKPSNGGC